VIQLKLDRVDEAFLYSESFAERILPAHQTCGYKRLSTTSSGCKRCSSRKELRTTESIQSNRRNGTTFQLLGAVREC